VRGRFAEPAHAVKPTRPSARSPVTICRGAASALSRETKCGGSGGKVMRVWVNTSGSGATGPARRSATIRLTARGVRSGIRHVAVVQVFETNPSIGVMLGEQRHDDLALASARARSALNAAKPTHPVVFARVSDSSCQPPGDDGAQ